MKEKTLSPQNSSKKSRFWKSRFLGWATMVLCLAIVQPVGIGAWASENWQSIEKTSIAGEGAASQKQMFEFIAKKNPSIDRDILSYLVKMYVVEANREGINYDIAFSQMALETNYLRFGNSVDHKQNNFAGLGVVKNGVKGHEFDTIYLGVRVHIQHLAAYALTTPLKQEMIDPRFRYVKRGSAPRIFDLTGKWAADPLYSEKISKLLKSLWSL